MQSTEQIFTTTQVPFLLVVSFALPFDFRLKMAAWPPIFPQFPPSDPVIEDSLTAYFLIRSSSNNRTEERDGSRTVITRVITAYCCI